MFEATIELVEMFQNHLSHLTSVFDDYQGDDYCAGLIFGKHGARILTMIAEDA